MDRSDITLTFQTRMADFAKELSKVIAQFYLKSTTFVKTSVKRQALGKRTAPGSRWWTKRYRKTSFFPLKNLFPADDLFGGRSRNSPTYRLKAEFCWLLDPVDGTNNYAAGITECGISLALLKACPYTATSTTTVETSCCKEVPGLARLKEPPLSKQPTNL